MQLDSSVIVNQLFSSVLTSCFTIIGGTTVFVFGQLAVKLFVEPLHEQARLLTEIAHSQTFYANVFGNARFTDEERLREASDTLRQQASAASSQHVLNNHTLKAAGCGK